MLLVIVGFVMIIWIMVGIRMVKLFWCLVIIWVILRGVNCGRMIWVLFSKLMIWVNRELVIWNMGVVCK